MTGERRTKALGMYEYAIMNMLCFVGYQYPFIVPCRQFQTATRQNEAEDPIQVPEDHSAVTEATSDASQSVEGPTAEENKFEEGPSTPVEEIEPVTPSEAVTEQANETVQNVQTDPLQAI